MKLTYRYLMLLNHNAYQKQMYDSIAELNLSLGQPRILDFLYENDGCMQKIVAQGCLLEPASVTSVLGKMELDGYVERRNEDGNRRSLYVYLTVAGKEMALKVREAMDAMEQVALAKLSPQEQDALMDLLRKVHSGLLGDEFVSKDGIEKNYER